MIENVLRLIAGIALLYVGGEALVRGAAALARRLGLSSLVIGLTVVAFGTSSPELAASLVAALQEVPDVALGNILGSNVANVGLILGLSALLRPMLASSTLLSREVPFMIFCGLVLLPMGLNGRYGRADGLLLLVLFGLFLKFLLSDDSRRPSQLPVEEPPRVRGGLGLQLLLVFGGVGLLTLGADQLVTGAVAMARTWGLPEQVIGLTMVAVGTSLPELAASLVAARHGDGDIVLGNVIGSNIFNVLLVLGTTAFIHPIAAELDNYLRDILVALGFSCVVLPLLFLRHRLRLGRLEGGLLLCGYAVYVWVVLA